MAVKKKKEKSYGSIEEQEIEEEPVASADEDLPDPKDPGRVDQETRRRLHEAQEEARRRRERAELEGVEPKDGDIE